MADTKSTTTKTLAGGTLTSTPKTVNNEVKNQYGFAVIKSDGSVVAWGQNATVPASLDGTIDATQIYSNSQNFVALRTDGSLIPLGNQAIDAATLKKLDGTVDVVSVASNWGAFAALRADGSVVTWGAKNFGGDNSAVTKSLDGTIDVNSIASNGNAFAAIRTDGSIVTWGDKNYGGDSSAVAKKLDGTVDVTSISSNDGAFAAIRTDGSVVTWGYKLQGGDSNLVEKQLDGTVDVSSISSNWGAFAAIRADGSVVTWGDSNYGGDSNAVAKQLDGTIDVTSIVSNGYAFAAIRADGSVVTWGYKSFGGDSSAVAKQLDGTVDVSQIYSNWCSFAAIRTDGSVVTWGYEYFGGDSSAVAKQLDGTVDVSFISSTPYSLAAIRTDGSVVTWGNKDFGGDSSAVAKQLDGTIDVKSIVSNDLAFAALRTDGSVITWGNSNSGGDSSKVASQLDGTIDVVSISSNLGAFSALRTDGSVVTWGNPNHGGDSSAVKAKLTSGVELFANNSTDDFYTAADKTTPPVVKNSAPTGTLEIIGTTKEDETLSISNKIQDADGIPAKINYQWLADGAAILGAVQTEYVLSQRDVGKKISVAFSYTDGLGVNESVISAATSKVVNKNDLPEGKVFITGSAMKGQTLTASNNITDEDGIGEISYQWMRDGKDILNAKNSTYTVSPSDLFKKISVKAMYTDLQNTKETVTSAETAKVTSEINRAPGGAVIIDGEMIQNRTLSVTHNIFDADGIASDFSYQWYTNNLPVQGATGKTYALTQEDVNKTVSVKVSYTDKLGKVESVLGGVVKNENDAPEGRIMIEGTPRVDEVLTVKNEIVDIDGLSGAFEYTWFADDEMFAQGDSIALAWEQEGKEISVIAAYTDNGGTFESLSSIKTSKVQPLQMPPEGNVVIMGEAVVGTELSILSTLTDRNGLGEFMYQWYSSGTLIPGATHSTYTPPFGEAGERISVNVQYVDGVGKLESVFSISTPVIRPDASVTLVVGDSPLIGTPKSDALAAKENSKVNYVIKGLEDNDLLVGADGNDSIDAGRGHDKIIGGKGNDSIFGAEGNDTLKGGEGADTMDGGDGDDYYYVDSSRDVVRETNKNVRLGGNDTVESTISYTLGTNVENLVLAGKDHLSGTGNEFDNVIAGNLGDNLLKGEAGKDTIFGYKGNDTIFGGDDEDVLDGGEGNDEIYGGAGDDYLRGGEGNDTLDGGEGEDVAVFDKPRTDYEITVNRMADKKLEFTVKYIGNGVDEGTDILKNMEMAKFADEEVISLRDISLLDNDAPELLSAEVEGNRLTLAFEDYDILSKDIAPASAFFVKNGGVANPVTAITVDQDKKTVELTLTNAVQNGQTVTFSYTDPTDADDANAIQDESGNDVASFKVDSVENKTPDTTPPEFQSAVVNGNTLVMQYADANPLSDKIAPISAFKVTSDGVANTVKNVAVDVQAKTVTLTLETAVKNAQLVTLDYKDLSSGDETNAIQDIFGNDAQSITRIVTNNTPDIKPPSFASAMVQNENKLVLIYIEANDLDAANIPPVSAFTVKTAGVDNPIKAVSVDAKAKTVTLDLTNSVKDGQTVQLSYTDPTTGNDQNAIQDVAGNDAISIPEQKFVFSASDMMAPVLTGLTLPTTIDVTKTSQTANFKANFIDDNSGVHSIRLDFDKSVGNYPYYVANLDKTGSGSKTVYVGNQDGIVKVTNLYVKDFAGNEKSYSASDLQKLEIPTAFQIVKDTTAPYLTSLTLPSKIDVTAGKQDATFSAKAGDDGVGVSSVSVYWDKSLSVNGGTSSAIGLSGSQGSSTQTVQTYTQTGTFKISSVSVHDNAGNTKSYTPDDLKKLGFATSFEVAGNGADTKAPELKSLTFPASIDVTKGSKSVEFQAQVTDDNAGVSSIYVSFDKYLQLPYYTGGLSLNTSTGKGTATAAINSDKGTFTISYVSVSDFAGNSKFYSTSDLKNLGISTTFEVIKDVNAPVLKELKIPAVIDVSAGNKAVTFAADVTDDNSGVKVIQVNLDKNLSLSDNAYKMLDLSNNGSLAQTVQSYSHSGTFNVLSVYVEDKAGNTKTYTFDELKKLGIQTSFEVSNAGDSTPPVFKSATVEGKNLVMTYTDDNELNVITADKGAFTVTNSGAANPVEVVAIDTKANTVTLSLTNAVKTDEAVTLSYKDPTAGNDTNAIQDVSGNDAISLNNVNVTNATAKPIDFSDSKTPVTKLPAVDVNKGNTVTGSDFSDNLVIVGGKGQDTIVAGDGADTVSGGGSVDTIDLTEKTQVADVLDYSSVNNLANLKQSTMNKPTGAVDLAKDGDVVTGFASGTDKIQFNAANFGKVGNVLVQTGGTAYAAGNNLTAADFVAVKIGDTASTLAANTAGKGRFIFDSANKVLFFDEKGDTTVTAGKFAGQADDLAVIRLTGATDTLVATDFIFA